MSVATSVPSEAWVPELSRKLTGSPRRDHNQTRVCRVVCAQTGEDEALGIRLRAHGNHNEVKPQLTLTGCVRRVYALQVTGMQGERATGFGRARRGRSCATRKELREL